MTADNLTDSERIVLQIKGYLPRLLFVLVGPSGVGKNTIIKKLLTNNPLMGRIRTYTTRQPRDDERSGEQYHFATFEEFRNLATSGKLMEADETTVGHDVYGLGALYSMPNDLFGEIPPQKHLVVAEVDIHGMRRLRKHVPDCVTIFVCAPPVNLQQRIRRRVDSNMDEASLEQRMNTAREQIRSAGEFDYVVFNEDQRLDETMTLLNAIVLAERARVREGIDLQQVIPGEALGEPVEQDQSP